MLTKKWTECSPRFEELSRSLQEPINKLIEQVADQGDNVTGYQLGAWLYDTMTHLRLAFRPRRHITWRSGFGVAGRLRRLYPCPEDPKLWAKLSTEFDGIEVMMSSSEFVITKSDGSDGPVLHNLETGETQRFALVKNCQAWAEGRDLTYF